MVNLDAAQRRLVVTMLAQLCPPTLVPSLFASRWKSPVLKSTDVAALDPDQGALLGPEDSELFRAERKKVKENPEEAEFASFAVHLRFYNWLVLDAKSRGDHRLARELLKDIRDIVTLAKSTNTGDASSADATDFAWRVIDPANASNE